MPNPEHQPCLRYQPTLFAYATLVDKDSLEDIIYTVDTREKVLSGSLSSSLYTLNDPEMNLSFGKFFVFPDISVRQEGIYRLKISLFKIDG